MSEEQQVDEKTNFGLDSYDSSFVDQHIDESTIVSEVCKLPVQISASSTCAVEKEHSDERVRLLEEKVKSLSLVNENLMNQLKVFNRALDANLSKLGDKSPRVRGTVAGADGGPVSTAEFQKKSLELYTANKKLDLYLVELTALRKQIQQSSADNVLDLDNQILVQKGQIRDLQLELKTLNKIVKDADKEERSSLSSDFIVARLQQEIRELKDQLQTRTELPLPLLAIPASNDAALVSPRSIAGAKSSRLHVAPVLHGLSMAAVLTSPDSNK